MQNVTLMLAAAAVLYLAGGVVVVSSLSRRGGKAPPWLFAAAAAALALHASALFLEVFGSGGTRFGFGPAVSSTMLFSVLFLVVGSVFHRIGPVLGISMIPAAVAAALNAVFPGEIVSDKVWTPLFTSHVILALMTYGLLATGVVQGCLMELQNRGFRAAESSIPQTGILSTLPPILVMEKVFFCLIGASFVFLTALIVIGGFVTNDVHGTFFRFDHKTFLSWLSWALCAVLLGGRWLFGWRGRKALGLFWTLCAVYAVAYIVYAFAVEFLKY